MSRETQEIVDICEQLPGSKRASVTDFARFLLAKEGDSRWEQIIANPHPLPKLDAFLEHSARESVEPLDPDKL